MHEGYFAVDSSQTADQTAEGNRCQAGLAVIPRMGFMETTKFRPPHCESWVKDTKTFGHMRLERQAAAKSVGMLRVPRCTTT